MSTVLTEVPQFASAHAAVKFAVNIVGRPMRPTMNRMSDKSGGGNGLTDIDAAGQAGIIMAKIRDLGDVMAAALIARSATRVLKCECKRPCCKGEYTNSEWLSAIDVLARKCYEKPCGCHTSYFVRSTMVRRIYGEMHTFVSIAELTEYDRDTISVHHARIHRWLLGQKASGVYAAKDGIENIGWNKIETSLKAANIVE